MAKYVRHFKTVSDFNTARIDDYIEPWTSVTDGKGLDYNKPYDKWIHTPFTIEALGSGNITWALGTKTIQYLKNDGIWETMNSGTTISVVEGDEVQFKGTNTNYRGNPISSTGQFNVKGNIMSLTDGDNFENANTVNESAFEGLFSGCTYLISADYLKLPVSRLVKSCYNCMFYNCTSLVAAPEFIATTLANYCCYGMFKNCSSLTKAPELYATTLVFHCYDSMFFGCTNLNYIKCMAMSNQNSNSISNWVSGVAAVGTFIKNSSIISDFWTTGVSGIPSGWTVQTATE